MSTFRYKATNKENRLVVGTIAAGNEKEAETFLRDKELKPLVVKKEKTRWVLFGGKSFPTKEKVLLCRYLSLMINAGIPLSEGFDLLITGTKNVTVQRFLEDVSSATRSGKSLFASFSKYRSYFGEVFLAMIKTGETSGTLSESLSYLGRQFQDEENLRQKILSAMLYPIIIISLMVVIGFGIFSFVLPRMAKVFLRLNLDMPFFTKLMFQASLFMEKNFLVVAGILAVLAIVSVVMITSKKGRAVIFFLLMHFPLAKKLILEYNLVRFTQSLSALIKGGVAITEALELSLRALSFVNATELADKFNKKLTQGLPLSVVFAESPIFPPLMSQMVAVGEKTGNLEKMLADLSSFYQEEVENSLKNFVTALEPILMIFVGVGVGVMVISIISPIYSLIGKLQTSK